MRREENDNFAHAVEALELQSVLEWIEGKCVNEGARERVRAIWPSSDKTEITRSLEEIEVVRAYHQNEGRLAIADVTEAKRWLARAVEQSDLITPEGLLAIAVLERWAFDLVRRFKGAEDRFALLRSMVETFSPNKPLIDSIDKAIDRDATIKDSATPRLADIRKRTRRAREDIRRHASELAKKHGSTQEPTFTGSRYLLVVPRERVRKKEGLVHGASQSGESLYFEPLGLVERNNTLETLAADEKAEETRILAELTKAVVEAGPELDHDIGVWERLDVLGAKASFANAFTCTSPQRSDDGTIRLEAARHPLLQLSLEEAQSQSRVVPLDLTLTSDSRALVITGPNAGGKTVALKTLGLIALLFQCGLPVPAREGTALALFDRIFADIGDEQSISSSLSTFTSHLRHLDAMVRAADDRSLCLIDEIGDGTDPEEGAALAIATLEQLLSHGAFVVATTHYGKVKSFALQAEGVSNASMLFDEEDDHPLYRVLQGIAGRSRGIATARRLGFAPEVVSEAERILGEEAFRLEELLSELETSRLAIERERDTLRRESESLQKLIESYSAKNRELTEFKSAQRARAQREAEELLVRARKDIEAMVKRIRESGAKKTAVRDAHQRIRGMLHEAQAAPDPARRGEPRRLQTVSPGQWVAIAPSGSPRGRVISVDKTGATVEINGKRISIKTGGLFAVEDASGEADRALVDIQVTAEPLEGTSLDVRGRDREDALQEVDRFLDRAVLSGVGCVKIIHGVGEGVLLQAIRDYLQDDPRIDVVRPGRADEGGAGVSFAELK